MRHPLDVPRRADRHSRQRLQAPRSGSGSPRQWVMIAHCATAKVPLTGRKGSVEVVAATLAAALGLSPQAISYTGKNRFDYLLEVASEEIVRTLQPDMTKLIAAPTRGVIVTSQSSTPGIDFVSRFFAPQVGVPEDPVTGSAHCCLAPYWGAKFGKERLTGYQASARGGIVRVRMAGERVNIGGQAVTVMRGELL